MKKNIIRSAGTSLLTVALVGSGVTAAQASGGNSTEVRAAGSCTSGSTWKLKAKPDNGRLDVELEVDSNRVGERWSVTMADNGITVFTGTLTTVAPSGSFEVNRMIANRAGADRITASARSTRTGERCSAVVVYGS